MDRVMDRLTGPQPMQYPSKVKKRSKNREEPELRGLGEHQGSLSEFTAVCDGVGRVS